MKQFPLFRRGLAAVLTLLLVCALPLSASAFFWDKKADVPAVADFTKNGLVGDTIAFSPQDFAVESGTDAVLSHITLASLPDPGAGSLTMGGQALTVGNEASQKMHNALRWLAAEQGVKIGGRAFLCWNPQGAKFPGCDESFEEEDAPQADRVTPSDYRDALQKTLLGLRSTELTLEEVFLELTENRSRTDEKPQDHGIRRLFGRGRKKEEPEYGPVISEAEAETGGVATEELLHRKEEG